MKDQFLLTFEQMPKGTAQQKGFNRKTGVFYKKKNVSSARNEFVMALKPYRPKKPSEAPIKLNIWLCFSIKAPKYKWGAWKTSSPDVDNYCKELIDVMSDLGWWCNDSQIVDLHISKTYAEKASIFIRWEELGERPL